jgi:hypothetical protein
MKITSDNTPGRMLIALRAGRMECQQIREAFPDSSSTLHALKTDDLIEKVSGYWTLTQAGRDVCPNRRDTKFEPLHTCKTAKSRTHGWSSTRKHNEVRA